MAGEEQRRRWSLQGKTALVTGGTKGIGFVKPSSFDIHLKSNGDRLF